MQTLTLHPAVCVCVARELRGQLSLSGCGGLSSSFGSSSAAHAVFAFLTFLAVPLCSRAAAESPEERRKVAAAQVHPEGDLLALQWSASTQTFLGHNSFTLRCFDRIGGDPQGSKG